MNETKIDETADAIRQRIAEGCYKAGERLPAERDLAEELHVSRQTIHAAMLRLQTEQQIEIRPRAGAFVHAPRQMVLVGPSVPAHLRHKKKADLSTLLALQQAETQICDVEPPTTIDADLALAQKMNLRTGTRVIRQQRLYLVNDVPYRIIETHRSSELPDIPSVDTPQFANMTENLLGMATPDAFERVQCRMPLEHEAQILHMSRNQPAFEIERWLFHGEIMVSYTCIIANAAFHALSYAYASCDSNWEDLCEKLQTNA